MEIYRNYLVRIFLILVVLYFIGTGLFNSAFFQKKDRINVVYSENNLAYYSLGLTDKVNYFIPFFPDLEVVVPGGYGHYRLGALAKLAGLEKKPDLFRKTYSMITSSMVDFYFYPTVSSKRLEIIFGNNKSNFSLPKFSILFFGQSNANFFDRLYLYFQFLGKTDGQFRTINSLTTVNRGNRTAFSADDFFEATQGVFYKRTYRSEQRNVQIVYTDSYNTAQQLGNILEGEGIRVVDLTGEQTNINNCKVIEDKKSFSRTAIAVGRFFGCQVSVGDTEEYDIILKLGKMEKEWEIE